MIPWKNILQSLHCRTSLTKNHSQDFAREGYDVAFQTGKAAYQTAGQAGEQQRLHPTRTVKWVPMLAPGLHSQPTQLWGNTELLSALTPFKFGAWDRVGGDMEKMTLWKHGISAVCWRYKKEWAWLKNGMAFHAYLLLLFLLRAGVFLKNSESGWRYMEWHTEVLPEAFVLHGHS